MAGIPQNFQSISPIIGSYDWLDVSSGAGYRRYYPVGCNNSTTVYFLSTKALDTATGLYSTTLSGGYADDPKMMIDLDFDVELKLASIIFGDALINLSYNSSINVGGNSYIVINVYHVSTGGVETSIGTTTTANRATTGAVAYFRDCIKVVLSKKNFGVGEKLRLNIQCWVNPASSPHTSSMTLYHDPSSSNTLTDADSRTIGTDITFDCPFKVNS